MKDVELFKGICWHKMEFKKCYLCKEKVHLLGGDNIPLSRIHSSVDLLDDFTLTSRLVKDVGSRGTSEKQGINTMVTVPRWNF